MTKAFFVGLMLVSSVASAKAQTPRIFSNPGNPSQSLEFDRQQCSDYGNASARQTLAASGSPSIPNSPWGRVLSTATQTLSQIAFQKFFDVAFYGCLSSLGWVEEHESAVPVHVELPPSATYLSGLPKLPADWADRASGSSNRRVAGWSEEKLPVINLNIRSSYDASINAAISKSAEAFVPNALALDGFFAAITIVSPRQKATPTTASIDFRIVSGGEWVFAAKPEVAIWLETEGEPTSVDVDWSAITYTRSTGKDGPTEYVRITLSAKQFERLADQQRVKGRLGNVTFEMPSEFRNAMKAIGFRTALAH